MLTTRQGLNLTAIEQLIAPHVADAMTAYEANRHSKNGMNNKTSGSAVGVEHTMEYVYHICNCAKNFQVKYATCTLMDGALTWWNSYVHLVELDASCETTCKELKQMITDEYCPRNEVHKIDTELYNLSVKGTNIVCYTKRFQELALLCPIMVTPEYQKIERYISGLTYDIQGNVTSSNPKKIQEAICMAHDLMHQVTRSKAVKGG
ncbi:reverse transcriptase domain-containing protein [Tanacetum coccineum]